MWSDNDGAGENAIHNRFTAWMEKVVKNLKIDYIRRKEIAQKRVVHSPAEIQDGSYEQDFKLVQQGEFDFAEERLSQAFDDLPLLRKRVLVLTFIKEQTAMEIAEELNCSVDYVYDQKRRALQKLRQQLSERSKADDF